MPKSRKKGKELVNVFTKLLVNMLVTVADPDLGLGGRGEGGGAVLFSLNTLPAFLPSVISYLLPKIRGGLPFLGALS